MKEKLISFTIALILMSGWAVAQEMHPLMHFTNAEMQQWVQDYENSPTAYLDPNFIATRGSFNLLNHLKKYPQDQGWCGNCWAWAATECMDIALHVQEGFKEDLSVQFINSCTIPGLTPDCCDGGSLVDFTTFYSQKEIAIRSRNENANWQDDDAGCDVECSSIGLDPHYGIWNITAETIPTYDMPASQAIANIKNVLHQNKAVWFGFFLPTDDDWIDFSFYYWGNEDESAVWHPDNTCEASSIAGAHAVLCVGYNDEDPENSYWIMLNSWGDANGLRPNGLFRLDMNINYNCVYNLPDEPPLHSLTWQTLDIEFGLPGEPSPTPTEIPTAPPENSPTPTPTLNPTQTPTANPKPEILLGGYLESYYITHSDESCIRADAFMCVEKHNIPISRAGLTNLPTDPWASPEIILDFTPDTNHDGCYYFNGEFQSEMADPPDELIFGMAATDGDANFTHQWPFMPIRNKNSSNNPAGSAALRERLVEVPNATPDQETLNMFQNSISHLKAHGAGPGENPVIWAAGYLDTNLVVGEPGILKIGAIVTADQSGDTIDRIEIIDEYGYPILQIEGSGIYSNGFYWFYKEWTLSETPLIQYPLFKMKAINSNGQKSDWWPVIKRHDAGDVAPQITGITSLNGGCRVEWSQTNDIEIDHFKVEWTDLEDSSMGAANNIPYTQHSYDITGLMNCHKYNIRVIALDLCATPLASTSVQGIPSQQPIPQNVRIEINSARNDFLIVWDETSTGIYGLFESYYADMRDAMLIGIYTDNSAPQPQIQDISIYFAVRSCISTKEADLDLAGCLSESVIGRKRPVNEGLAQNLSLLDVNNDNIDDLVLISEDHSLKMYNGQVDGSWILSGQTFSSPVKDYTLFDFNKDGSVDIAIAAPDKVLTYFNNGSGSMVMAESLFPPGESKVIASADLDAKGTSDIIVGNSSGTLVKENDASGQTQEVQQLDSGDTKIVVAKDIDGDGKKDIVTATENGENIIWKKDESGHYVPSGPAIQTWGTESIEISDRNNDGCADLIVMDCTGEEVVFLNDCSGNFAQQ